MSQNKKKFTLNELEVDSFVTTLSEKEQEDLLGGHPGVPPTECGDPQHCPVKQEISEDSQS